MKKRMRGGEGGWNVVEAVLTRHILIATGTFLMSEEWLRL